MQEIIDKIYAGERINPEEGARLLREGNLYQLGMAADRRRRELHPDKVVTYIIDRNINYTDICISGCKFCAFYTAPEKEGGYILSFEELGRKIEETRELGGNQILLQGGLHPDKTLDYYEEMLRFIKSHGIHVHGFSPPEICHFADINGITTSEVLTRLQAAGLDSMPGGGAEILSDRVRKDIAPRKCLAEPWIRVMEEAHKLGMKTTATMMFGHVETLEERMEHLERVRSLQDRTGGFTAFIPWPFQPENTVYSHLPKTGGLDYLKMLALTRIYLDNVPNIQASWVTQGPKIAQLALFFGANDFGSTMIEENVVSAAGISFSLSEEDICRLVKSAGFEPRRRRMDYSAA
ncbi:MAG: cyclic dehypoxanthinyl futalosine synthase [Desulfurivibrionaceae bacterium]